MRKKRDKLEELISTYQDCKSGDAWGECMGWLFALADWIHGKWEVPEEWEFRQSPMGPDRTVYEYKEIASIRPGKRDSLAFGTYLWNIRQVCIAEGKDY